MAGMNRFTHFVGYVVAREDGQNLGRVKVKALGYHDLNPEVVSADDLPWAPVVDGTYGAVATVPLEGEWVLGAFIDGADAQHPIVLGRLPGYNSQAPAGADTNGNAKGEYATDPYGFGRYPLHPALGGEGISDIEGMDVAISESRSEDELTDAIGFGYDKREERLKEEELAAKPTRDLDNRVLSSTDDNNFILLTEGEGGYIQIHHHTGSTIQINEDGDVLIKTCGEGGGMQNMIDGGRVEHVGGDSHTMINQDYTLKVDANGKMWFGGDLDIECENFRLTARGSSVFNTAGAHTQKSHGPMFIDSGQVMNVVSRDKLKVQSLDLTTIESQNNGIFLYATGAQNKIDMTSGSIKMATEVKPNTLTIEELGIEPDTHELGGIHISSANNLFIETLGAPVGKPANLEQETADGYIDVTSSAGIRMFSSGGDNDFHISSANRMQLGCGADMAIHAGGKASITTVDDMYLKTNSGKTIYMDDFVRMAEGGSVSLLDNEGQPAPATLAMICSEDTGDRARLLADEETVDAQVAQPVSINDSGDNKAVAPHPPESLGDGLRGYKSGGIKAVPDPGQTNSLTTEHNPEEEG